MLLQFQVRSMHHAGGVITKYASHMDVGTAGLKVSNLHIFICSLCFFVFFPLGEFHLMLDVASLQALV